MCVLSIELLFLSAGITGGWRGDFAGNFGGMAGVAGVAGHEESSDSGFSGNWCSGPRASEGVPPEGPP